MPSLPPLDPRILEDINFTYFLPKLTENMLKSKDYQLPPKDAQDPEFTVVVPLGRFISYTKINEVDNDADFKFTVIINNQRNECFVRIRPGIKEFLDKLKYNAEIIVFSDSTPDFVDPILDYIDPGKTWSKNRLYYNNCIRIDDPEDGSVLLVKELSVVNRDKMRTVIISDYHYKIGYDLDNGIIVKSWVGDNSISDDDSSISNLDNLYIYLLELMTKSNVRITLAEDLKLKKKLLDAMEFFIED